MLYSQLRSTEASRFRLTLARVVESKGALWEGKRERQRERGRNMAVELWVILVLSALVLATAYAESRTAGDLVKTRRELEDLNRRIH